MNPGRRYALVTFLTWLPTGLYVAPLVLLMLDRGLSVPTIAMIGIAYSATTALLELPTGGLADTIGRRAVLLASCAASLASLVMLGFATTAMVFVVSSFLRGVARALGSGPAEAWYVDTVHATQGPDAPIGKGLAHGQVASSTGLAIGTITGGLIPLAFTGVVAVPLAIPMFAAAAVEAVRLFVIVMAMPEPRLEIPQSARPAARSWTAIHRDDRDADAVRLAWADPVLIRLVAITGCIGIMLATIELLTPPWLATVTGTFETAGYRLRDRCGAWVRGERGRRFAVTAGRAPGRLARTRGRDRVGRHVERAAAAGRRDADRRCARAWPGRARLFRTLRGPGHRQPGVRDLDPRSRRVGPEGNHPVYSIVGFASGGSDRRQRPIASVGADFACCGFHRHRGRDWHIDTGVASNRPSGHKLRFTP